MKASSSGFQSKPLKRSATSASPYSRSTRSMWLAMRAAIG
jgi:hypothetical protein